MLYNQVELCKKIKADGVRMPETITDMIETREALGHEFIIGATAHTFEGIKNSNAQVPTIFVVAITCLILKTQPTLTQNNANS